MDSKYIELEFAHRLQKDLIELHGYCMIDKTLDELYDRLEDALEIGEYKKVDSFLQLYDFDELNDLSVMVAVLSVTLPWKDKLSERDGYITRMRSFLISNHRHDHSDVFAGLI